MEFHEYANLFPMMEGKELNALALDISVNGLIEPIFVFEGKILDGRNRYLACRDVKINPRFEDYTGKYPLQFVISKNLQRRHLDESQRAMVANRIATMKQGERTDLTAIAVKLSQTQASELMNVSVDSVQRAGKVIEQGSDELIQSVDSGKVAVSTASVIAELPKEEQNEIIAKGEKEIIKKAGEIKRKRKKEKERKREEETKSIITNLPDISERYELYCHDITKSFDGFAKFKNKIDVIITDPPYGKDHLDLYKYLVECALFFLKPNGSLLVMTGQYHLPKTIIKLSEKLNYYWTLAYLTPGQSTTLWNRKVNTFWKPILWFVNGGYKGECVGDVIKSLENDKEFHKWGQSISGITDLVRKVSSPGDFILDPFLGGGTTGISSLSLNRRFIGFDNDQGCIETTKKRIAMWTQCSDK